MKVRARSYAAIAALALALAVVFLRLPGGGFLHNAGSGAAGTPAGILFLGLVVGLLNGLIAAGLVLIYRSARVINFAQGALGALGATFTFYLIQLNNWPYLVAFGVGILVSATLGAVVELAIIRRFFYAPRLAVTVLTVALAGFLVGAGNFVLDLPIFREDAVPADITTSTLTLPFKDFSFQLGDLPLRFGFGHLFALGMGLTALLCLGFFLRYTRWGVAVRATAENAERAQLLGISVKTLSTVVWTVAAVLSGLGLILTGTASGFVGITGLAPGALVPALAAAVIARMRSLPVAVATGIGITMMTSAFNWSFQGQVGLVNVGLLVIIVVSLLAQRRAFERAGAGETVTWEAATEIRPTPREILELPSVRRWRWVFLTLVGVGLGLFPWITSTGATNYAGYIAITAIVLVSLLVLTGWAGQVSLGQFAFVAIGAVLGGALTSKAGVPFLIAVPIASLATSGFAVLVGIPALRIKGLFLAVATLAFAFTVENVLFNESYFGWLLPESVSRPTFFLLDFEDERSMYYLTLVALALAIGLVTTLRGFRTGRVLIAVRESDTDLESFGVRAVRAKLMAFAVSGFLCGLAGVMLAHHQRAVTASSFPAQLSLDVFLYAVVGGISSLSGVVLGTIYFSIQGFISNPTIEFLVGPLGVLTILYMLPGGLASFVYGVRDSAYRIIAQRRQLVVPSLIADYDPSTAGKMLIPIAEEIPRSGLAAVADAGRYRQDSDLYGLDGGTDSKERARRAAREDSAALIAAAALAEPSDEAGEPAE